MPRTYHGFAPARLGAAFAESEMRLVARFGLLVLVAGCGLGSSPGAVTCGATTVESCNFSSLGQCQAHTSVVTGFKQTCVGSGTTYASAPCPSSGALGTCAAGSVLFTYYAPLTAASAQSSCTQGGGTWCGSSASTTGTTGTTGGTGGTTGCTSSNHLACGTDPLGNETACSPGLICCFTLGPGGSKTCGTTSVCVAPGAPQGLVDQCPAGQYQLCKTTAECGDGGFTCSGAPDYYCR
jgi:hypothetical protein